MHVDGTMKTGRAVVIAARDREKSAAAVAELEGQGGKAAAGAVEITDEASCRAMGQTAGERVRRLDLLVNNAGANFFHGLLGATKADIERCLAVDFYPAWAVSQEAQDGKSEAAHKSFGIKEPLIKSAMNRVLSKMRGASGARRRL